MTSVIRSNSLIKKLGGRILYLVGMMGSGKSQTGPHLAQALNYTFIDQDELIEKVAKTTIDKLFQDEGEKNFRDLETQVLKEIGTRHSLVVSTGGGVVMKSENWGILHQGIVVWLDVSKEQLIARLKEDTKNRPLLENKNLNNSIEDLINERASMYAESDLQIHIEQEDPKEVAMKIIQNLPNILIDPEDSNVQQTTAT